MGLKNKGPQGPLNRVYFFTVLYLFEGRSALQRGIYEVVFSGGWKNWVYYPIFVSYGMGSDVQRDQVSRRVDFPIN